MDDSSTLASNADRDRVVARLAEAHVDGRLTVEELEELHPGLEGKDHAPECILNPKNWEGKQTVC